MTADEINSSHYIYKAAYDACDRCNNVNHPKYKDYGARGIRFKFASILEAAIYIKSTLGNKPSKEYSLDREDNDGHYEPGNLRWATKAEQSKNQRQRNKSKNKTSKYMFVHWASNKNRWVVKIILDGKTKQFGSFKNEEDANECAKKLNKKMTINMDEFKEMVQKNKCEDLTGKKFGLLEPIKIVGSRKGSAVWLCRCYCSEYKKATAQHLKRGSVKTCGKEKCRSIGR